MEITLRYMALEHWPRPDGWTVVGTVDGAPLAYDPERRPHALADGGPVPLDPAEVNLALVAAVNRAGLRLWPGGWGQALPAAFGLNTRSISRDRILRSGLAPNVLRVLGSASTGDDAEGVGRLLSALAHYADQYGGGTDSGPSPALDYAREAGENALEYLRSVRGGKTFKREDRE